MFVSTALYTVCCCKNHLLLWWCLLTRVPCGFLLLHDIFANFISILFKINICLICLWISNYIFMFEMFRSPFMVLDELKVNPENNHPSDLFSIFLENKSPTTQITKVWYTLLSVMIMSAETKNIIKYFLSKESWQRICFRTAAEKLWMRIFRVLLKAAQVLRYTTNAHNKLNIKAGKENYQHFCIFLVAFLYICLFVIHIFGFLWKQHNCSDIYNQYQKNTQRP